MYANCVLFNGIIYIYIYIYGSVMRRYTTPKFIEIIMKHALVELVVHLI